jgi:hypothetical protein
MTSNPKYRIPLLVCWVYSCHMIAREKEQKIRKLLKEDRPWNYICQEAQCSPNTIGKVQEKDERRRHQVAAKSSRSKALQMYDSNYTPLDVAIKLDISPDEAKNHKLDYWMLKGMDKFEQLYRNYGDSLPFIISKFFELEARNISLKDL